MTTEALEAPTAKRTIEEEKAIVSAFNHKYYLTRKAKGITSTPEYKAKRNAEQQSPEGKARRAAYILTEAYKITKAKSDAKQYLKRLAKYKLKDEAEAAAKDKLKNQ